MGGGFLRKPPPPPKRRGAPVGSGTMSQPGVEIVAGTFVWDTRRLVGWQGGGGGLTEQLFKDSGRPIWTPIGWHYVVPSFFSSGKFAPPICTHRIGSRPLSLLVVLVVDCHQLPQAAKGVGEGPPPLVVSRIFQTNVVFL